MRFFFFSSLRLKSDNILELKLCQTLDGTKWRCLFHGDVGFWSVFFVCLQWNKALLCNSNTMLERIFFLLRNTKLWLYMFTSRSWSLLLSVWQRVQYCVLNYCRTLPQRKAMVECQAAGGPLRFMLSEVEKQWSTEMKWSYCHLRAQINPGQSNEHCSSRLRKEVMGYSAVARFQGPRQRTKGLLWKRSWQGVGGHTSSCF